MYRNTYMEVYLDNIKDNVSKIINTYSNYKYYFGVVKADCYGHGIETVQSIIDGGCNYLAVAMLEEALKIRKINSNIPILCLGNIKPEYLKICIENNITITINSLEYTEKLINYNLDNLKVHIKINTGMNRLGINNINELNNILNILGRKNVYIEGIYTHIYEANNIDNTNKQLDLFRNIVTHAKFNFKIIHAQASDAITNYEKLDFINGCRLGIIMYGFNDKIKLKSTFKLISEVIQIHKINEQQTIGYNGTYKANSGDVIAVIAIGYDDGIIRKNKGRLVYINNNSYPIVGNICMDMLFVKVDETINLYDKVEIIKDINHVCEIANYLDTIPYEVLCLIGKRIPRIYKKI